MLKLISINRNNTVAYVETDSGEIFGIVNAFHVTDAKGLKIEGSVVDILDVYVDIEQDYNREANVICFIEDNGESSKLYIDSVGFDLVDTTPF